MKPSVASVIERGEDHAFDDKMRRAQQQLAILERAGLAFVAIHDDESARVIAALNRACARRRARRAIFASREFRRRRARADRHPSVR